MRIEIGSECGEIKLGDSLLPGIVQEVAIDGSVKFDEKSVSGSSGSKKQVIGFDDATLSVKLLLQNDAVSTPYEKLQQLIGMFKSLDSEAKPQIYQLTNQLAAAWGIGKVLFKACKVTDGNKYDYLQANLDFTEWEPSVVKVEARAVRGAIKDRAGTTVDLKAALTKYQEAEELLDDLYDPGETGTENSEEELPESPAIDDDDGI